MVYNLLKRLFCSSEENKIRELEEEIQELKEAEWPDITTTVVDKKVVTESLSELEQWDRKQTYWWDDYKYRISNVEDFESVAKRDTIDEKEYVDEFFDCDNYSDYFASLFARRYKCNSVGIVISPEAEPPHAFNVVVVENNGEVEARFWEPQEDMWVTNQKHPKYTLKDALIRI